jgi:hypothetical protein
MCKSIFKCIILLVVLSSSCTDYSEEKTIRISINNYTDNEGNISVSGNFDSILYYYGSEEIETTISSGAAILLPAAETDSYGRYIYNPLVFKVTYNYDRSVGFDDEITVNSLSDSSSVLDSKIIEVDAYSNNINYEYSSSGNLN